MARPRRYTTAHSVQSNLEGRLATRDAEYAELRRQVLAQQLILTQLLPVLQELRDELRHLPARTANAVIAQLPGAHDKAA